MIRKPTPIKLSEATREVISGQLNVQTTNTSTPKSADPVNYPVFEVMTGKKVLIYVPNHTVETDEGTELRMDKPLIHPLKDGKRFLSYRCVSGLRASDEKGNVIYDGSCPLCEGTELPWDLANLVIEKKCRQIGAKPDDKENPQVKAIRSAEFSSRVIKEPNRYFTFPIVVIDTVNDDGKTIAKDENGKPIMTPKWYSISEAQYKKKWEPTLEGMEDEPTHPGGRFFVLNFIYDTKGKEPNKRDAAQNVTVISRNLKGVENIVTYLDNVTKDWTPEKAQEMVIANQLFSIDDLAEVANNILEEPSEMFNLLKATDTSNVSSLPDSGTGFNLQAPQETKELSSGVEMDETDEDVDFE